MKMFVILRVFSKNKNYGLKRLLKSGLLVT